VSRAIAEVERLIADNGELHVSIHQTRRIVNELLSEFDPEVLAKPKKVEVDELVDFLGFRLRYERLSKGIEILGVTCFEPMNIPVYNPETGKVEACWITEKTVVINVLLLEERYKGRYAYTVAHEIGHIIFDNAIMRERKHDIRGRALEEFAEELCFTVDEFLERNAKKEAELAKAERQRIERLCDNFAACLLIPDGTVDMLIRAEIKKYKPSNSSACLYVNPVEEDKQFVHSLVSKIVETYGASREAAGYKLRDTRIIRGISEILDNKGI